MLGWQWGIEAIPGSQSCIPYKVNQKRCHRIPKAQFIAERGRMGWQRASGYTKRARAETAISRYKRMIGDGLRSRTEERRVTESDVAVQVLNRMLVLGQPTYVRIA
jgi:hypothetical protein